MAAVQVKHAENKQLQNKHPTAEKRNGEITGIYQRKFSKSSANQAFMELLSTFTAQS